GSIEPAIPAMLWKGQHPANTIKLIDGDLGIALFPGETAVFASLVMRAGTLELGPGAALTGPLDKTGGTITVEGSAINGAVLIRGTMPTEPGELFSKHAADAIEQLVLDSRRNPSPRETRTPPTSGQRPPIRGILLQDLVNEGQADLAVTEKVTNPQIQKISLLGEPTAGTITLGFKGKTTPALPYQATAAQVQTALEGLSTIGKGNVTVTLGVIAKGVSSENSPAEFPGVWLVEFTGLFSGPNPPRIALLTATGNLTGLSAIVTAATVWKDTGLVETIQAIVPVGTPTPMRAGAVAVGIWFPGIGYGCVACEGRE